MICDLSCPWIDRNDVLNLKVPSEVKYPNLGQLVECYLEIFLKTWILFFKALKEGQNL